MVQVVAEVGRYEIEGHDPMSVVTNLQGQLRRILRRSIMQLCQSLLK